MICVRCRDCFLSRLRACEADKRQPVPQAGPDPASTTASSTLWELRAGSIHGYQQVTSQVDFHIIQNVAPRNYVFDLNHHAATYHVILPDTPSGSSLP